MVFLGKRVDLHARPGYGRLEIGRWVHIGDGNSLRCHEGSLRIGDKVVMGKDNTVNCYLDVEIGAATIVADWVYVTDFDHVTADVHRPDQGPGHREVTRADRAGLLGRREGVGAARQPGRAAGSVLGAHAVVRGEIPEYSVAVGAPARVVRNRLADYAADAERRAAIADMARKTDAAVRQAAGSN